MLCVCVCVLCRYFLLKTFFPKYINPLINCSFCYQDNLCPKPYRKLSKIVCVLSFNRSYNHWIQIMSVGCLMAKIVTIDVDEVGNNLPVWIYWYVYIINWSIIGLMLIHTIDFIIEFNHGSIWRQQQQHQQTPKHFSHGDIFLVCACVCALVWNVY